MVHHLTYLVGLPYHGSPDVFYYLGSTPHTLPKSINVDIVWPTSLVGGCVGGLEGGRWAEGCTGSEFGCGWT